MPKNGKECTLYVFSSSNLLQKKKTKYDYVTTSKNVSQCRKMSKKHFELSGNDKNFKKYGI